ncbi:MAG TPA: FAD-dependent monooxygenase [Candidatus Polarisedimenticolia bacterium]
MSAAGRPGMNSVGARGPGEGAGAWSGAAGTGGAFGGGRSYDVVVVGGGPAGSTVATLLGGAGARVLLCDAAIFPRHKLCGEFLPPAALPIFDRLGVRGEVERLRPRRHVGMAVIAPGGARFLGRYGAGAPWGLAVRRFDLDAVLLQQARRSGATVLEGTRVADLSRAADGLWDLTLQRSAPGGTRSPSGERPTNGGQPPQVRARAIVGADGRNSIVARRLGLRRADSHRRFAVMGHFEEVAGPADHGEMIVTQYGYCGINPLPAGLANVCIVLDPDRPGGRPSGRAGLRAFFDEKIAAHPLTRERMAPARLVDRLRATGPISCRASRVVDDAALLVGDAAGFFDPFTGEGIAMALRGGMMAAEMLLEALRCGDLSRAALRPYEAGRRAAFAARLRLDRILQRVLVRPRLAGWLGARLQGDPRLADLLACVAGDTADAREILRPAFAARLLFG